MLPFVGAPHTVTVWVSPASGSLMAPHTVTGTPGTATIGGMITTGGLQVTAVAVTGPEAALKQPLADLAYR